MGAVCCKPGATPEPQYNTMADDDDHQMVKPSKYAQEIENNALKPPPPKDYMQTDMPAICELMSQEDRTTTVRDTSVLQGQLDLDASHRHESAANMSLSNTVSPYLLILVCRTRLT